VKQNIFFCFILQYSKIAWTFLWYKCPSLCASLGKYCCYIVTDDATYCMVISPLLEKFSVDWEVLEWNLFLPLGHEILRSSLSLTIELVLNLHSPDIPAQQCAVAHCTYRRIEYSLLECISHLLAISIYPHHLCRVPIPLQPLPWLQYQFFFH
jgi:hypothetical protein